MRKPLNEGPFMVGLIHNLLQMEGPFKESWSSGGSIQGIMEKWREHSRNHGEVEGAFKESWRSGGSIQGIMTHVLWNWWPYPLIGKRGDTSI